MNEYKITLVDPQTRAVVGYEYLTTDDSIEAYEWIADIEFDYSTYYDLPVIGEVEVF